MTKMSCHFYLTTNIIGELGAIDFRIGTLPDSIKKLLRYIIKSIESEVKRNDKT